MITYWVYAALALALVQWTARWREIRWLHYATKPAVLLALIFWTWQVSGWQGPLRWFGIALVFSLLGDVLLMLPPSFFLSGLGAFLLGHIFYILGLNTGALSGGLLYRGAGFLFLVMAVGLIGYFSRALSRGAYSVRIRAGVIAYIVVILFMVFSAVSTFFRPNWQTVNAVTVMVGAFLFAFSDSLLAYDRFVKKVWHAHVWIMVSYHLAQFLIVLGALRQFAR